MSGARVYRFRSEEDPSVPPDPEICAAAPFAPNARLGAVLWEESGDGAPRRLGTATACLEVTDPAFPPGSRVPFHAVFHLPEGSVTASGDGTIVSNDVPVPGLVLAVCHLRVVDAPKGFSGGAAASLSVFNPAGLRGYATGSHWTVQLFQDSGAAVQVDGSPPSGRSASSKLFSMPPKIRVPGQVTGAYPSGDTETT